uniref:Uncharacterized protein n=1 Tax=Leersia perrieri TaxID=77586 RepID=A0A0D9WUV3_9ORYZ
MGGGAGIQGQLFGFGSIVRSEQVSGQWAHEKVLPLSRILLLESNFLARNGILLRLLDLAGKFDLGINMFFTRPSVVPIFGQWLDLTFAEIFYKFQLPEEAMLSEILKAPDVQDSSSSTPTVN